MTEAASLVDWALTLRLAALALLIAALPLGVVWVRARGADPQARMTALTAMTLFLTFDLVVFGAFTRLTDSGLGCPDWPGCYGHASPLGAHRDIQDAQAAMPHGPVTFSKAWIEMIHRYLAMMVGVLILARVVVGWLERRRLALPFGWTLLTLAWVLMQGLFGKYTVTLKLYPAVVTAHLLGGLGLLALLVVQHQHAQRQSLPLSSACRRWAWAASMLLWLQVGLGGWVSTNYAVLACSGFPTCNGQWWPDMNLAEGFTLLRGLGLSGQGGYLPFDALVAIHWMHRLAAAVVVVAVVVLAASLWRTGPASSRRWALLLIGLLVWQVASGLSNVVLGWPLAAALAHSAGAAGLVGATTALLVRMGRAGTQSSTVNSARALPA